MIHAVNNFVTTGLGTRTESSRAVVSLTTSPVSSFLAMSTCISKPPLTKASASPQATDQVMVVVVVVVDHLALFLRTPHTSCTLIPCRFHAVMDTSSLSFFMQHIRDLLPPHLVAVQPSHACLLGMEGPSDHAASTGQVLLQDPIARPWALRLFGT